MNRNMMYHVTCAVLKNLRDVAEVERTKCTVRLGNLEGAEKRNKSLLITLGNSS